MSSRVPFEAIVKMHGPTVLRVCRAVVGAVDADDAWSETFLTAMKAYPSLPDDAIIEAWLVTIAHRRAIDVGRARSRRAVPTDSIVDHPDRHERTEPAADLIVALAALPDKQRQSVAYHYLAGLSYAEVASILGGTAAAARRAAATDAGLVRVAYANEDHDLVVQTLADRISPRILHHPTRLDDAARELDEYFTGRRHSFSVTLDWRLSAGFRATVLQHLTDIEYGHTASYAIVAQLAGRPNAFRAVGTACATNPLPVVVPCRRVVKSDGSIGGYLGGADAKAKLLELEAAA